MTAQQTPQDRLADAISGERRDWHRVEVETDDLAAVLAALRATPQAGRLGLSFGNVGCVLQAVAEAITGREEHSRAEVIAALQAWALDGGEDLFWDVIGGPAVDWLTEELFAAVEESR